MFDIGWVEMMVVIVVLIIVIGPKDLPVVLHTMGRWVARARAMARSFQDSIEDMARESGLDEIRDEARSIRDFRLDEEVEKAIDPKGELKEGIAPEIEGGSKGADGDKGPAQTEPAAENGNGAPDQGAGAAEKPAGASKPGVEAERPRTKTGTETGTGASKVKR